MKKFYKWLIAHTTSRRVWRVTYIGNSVTYPLSKLEAVGLSETFGAILWIDYDNGLW